MHRIHEIERLRTELIAAAEQLGILTDPDVVELSQRLDALIFEVQSQLPFAPTCSIQ